MILFAVAVLAGAACVLTPCVLPLLPAILAVSPGRGRRRVWGIVAGIEISFFVLALLLAGTISSLGLPPNVLPWIAAVLLAGFGLVLLIPRLHAVYTNGISKLTARVPQSRRSGGGFLAGLFAGLPLGLVWTPCAGPILAGISVAASASRFSTQTVVTMSGYALGMVGPLTAVVVGGRMLTERLRNALGGGRRVVAAMGLVLLATAGLVGFGGLNQLNRFIAENISLTSTPTAALERRALAVTGAGAKDRIHLTRSQLSSSGYPDIGRVADLGPAPNFSGISRWYNTGGRRLSMGALRGKVVLVDFWTYSCINCIRALPRVRGWYDRYQPDGLVVVGVHTPEFEFEKDPGRVGRAVRDFDIRYPVALDPDRRTWERFFNRFWPADYLIDQDGRIVLVHYGEGAYSKTENAIRRLLGKQATRARRDDATEAFTPETYIGSRRAARFAGDTHGAGFAEGEALYVAPRDSKGRVTLDPDWWSYAGSWTVGPERATAGDEARVYIHFRARKVFLVAGPGKRRGPGRIAVDGDRSLYVDRYRLYEIRSGPAADRLLRIDVAPGIEVFALTFG